MGIQVDPDGRIVIGEVSKECAMRSEREESYASQMNWQGLDSWMKRQKRKYRLRKKKLLST